MHPMIVGKLKLDSGPGVGEEQNTTKTKDAYAEVGKSGRVSNIGPSWHSRWSIRTSKLRVEMGKSRFTHVG